MIFLIILNRNPYDGTDVTWNALRLAEKLCDKGTVRIFLMNDSVDLAREGMEEPDAYKELNLQGLLKELMRKGVEVKACGTCKIRCGVYRNKPYFKGIKEAKMTELSEWIEDADRVISF